MADLSQRLSQQMKANTARLGSAALRGAVYGATTGLGLGTAATVATAGAGCGTIPAGAVLGAGVGAASFSAASLLVSAVQTGMVLLGAKAEEIPASHGGEDFASRLAEKNVMEPFYRG